MRRGLTLGILIVWAVLLWPASDAAAAPATVKLVGPSPYTVHLKAVGSAYQATFDVSIENDGDPLGPDQYSLTLISDRAGARAPQAVGSVTLAGQTITPVPVTIRVDDDATTSLTLVLSLKTGAPPSSETLTLTRAVAAQNFWVIGLAPLLAGIIVFFLLYFLIATPSKDNPGHLLWTPTGFSFSGSWATTITGLLTAIAAVLTTTSVLTALVPGVDSSPFIGATILFALVLALGPISYSALTREHEGTAYGTRAGYRAAAAITTVAFSGQLSTVGAILALSGLVTWLKALLVLFLLAATVVMVAYVLISGRQLEALKPPGPPKTGTGTGVGFAPGGPTTVIVVPSDPRPPGIP